MGVIRANNFKQFFQKQVNLQVMAFDGPEFKRLKARWYKKLEKAGFEDLEYAKHEYGAIKPDISGTHPDGNPASLKLQIMETTQNYFEWAMRMLNEANFKNRKHKRIWQLHSEGLSTRDIGAKVGLEWSWIAREIKYIRKYLGTGF